MIKNTYTLNSRVLPNDLKSPKEENYSEEEKILKYDKTVIPKKGYLSGRMGAEANLRTQRMNYAKESMIKGYNK